MKVFAFDVDETLELGDPPGPSGVGEGMSEEIVLDLGPQWIQQGATQTGHITIERVMVPKPIGLTVVIVTLGRRQTSLKLLLDQIQEQTLPRDRWQLIVWQKTDEDMNEFDQMNKALHATKFNAPDDVFLTLGDDHELRETDFLEKGLSFFERDPRLMVQTICTTGRMWSDKWESDCRPMLGSGGSLWIRYAAWQGVGEFEVDWGLGIPQKGWRADSAMLLAIVDKYGMQSYRNTTEVTVYHPGRSESPWQPLVEREFWRKYKHHLIKTTIPIDPRLAQLVIASDETDPVALEASHKVIEEFIAKGIPRETFDDGIKQIRQLLDDFDRQHR